MRRDVETSIDQRPYSDRGERSDKDQTFRSPDPRHLALFVATFVLCAGFAKWIAILPGTGISIWPPAGLLIATLLLSDRRGSWPWWVIAAVLTELATNALFFHNPWAVAILISAGNGLQAVVGAWLITRVRGRPFRLEALPDVIALVGFGALLGPTVSATCGALTLAWAESLSFDRGWTLLWTGDATGVLILAPMVMVAAQNWTDRKPVRYARAAEAGLVALTLLAASGLSLGGYLPYAYIVLPPLLWAAVRFELPGAVVTIGALTIMSAEFTQTGVTPFAAIVTSSEDEYITLQLFLATSSLTALVVAAIARQYRIAVDKLRTAKAQLEERVVERTARLRESERRLGSVLDALPIGVALLDQAGKMVFGNEVYRRYVPETVPSLDDARKDLWEGFDSAGRRISPENYPGARALRGERVWPGQDFMHHGDAVRGPFWTRVAAIPFRNESGEIVGATAVITDIDERVKATAAVAASERRLRLAQEAARLGNWESDASSGLVELSETACDLFGAPRGQKVTEEFLLSRVHPEERARVEANIARVSNSDSPQDFRLEYRVVLPDGRLRWIEDQGRMELDDGGLSRRGTGILRDITERKSHEQQIELLMREVNHRSKNLLSVVQAIARQTAAGGDPQEFLKRFGERLRVLAANQDLLVNSGWQGVDIEQLFRAVLGHFQDLIGSRIHLDGPSVTIAAAAAQTFGMALHELATNAAKYGSLSGGQGEVRITWALLDSSMDRRFTITWQERGGPKIDSLGAPGFGTTVIERMSRLALNGDVSFDLDPEGLCWRLDCPADKVLEGGEPNTDLTAFAVKAEDQRVLVVEDDFLVADDIAVELAAAGFSVLGPASTVEQALRVIDAQGCDAAVLDINLGRETSEPIAARLRALGIPFVVMSAYSPHQRPVAFMEAPTITKPFVVADLVKEVTRSVASARPYLA